MDWKVVCCIHNGIDMHQSCLGIKYKKINIRGSFAAPKVGVCGPRVGGVWLSKGLWDDGLCLHIHMCKGACTSTNLPFV